MYMYLECDVLHSCHAVQCAILWMALGVTDPFVYNGIYYHIKHVPTIIVFGDETLDVTT